MENTIISSRENKPSVVMYLSSSPQVWATKLIAFFFLEASSEVYLIHLLGELGVGHGGIHFYPDASKANFHGN